MQIKVLGWSGGISANLRTTSFLIDDDVLIDAGTGVGELSLAQMKRVRHVFLTHSHLDHIVGLPLLADSIFDDCGEVIVVHAQEATIAALKAHIFNWIIWPDFSELPSVERPSLRFEVMQPGETRRLCARDFEMIAVNHTVPGVGYTVQTENAVVAFSGDTTTNDSFWERLNRHESLDLLFVEAAFSDRDIEISRLSKHYCPSLLGDDVRKLKHRPEVWLTHFKPGEEDLIYRECVEKMPTFQVQYLRGNETFKL